MKSDIYFKLKTTYLNILNLRIKKIKILLKQIFMFSLKTKKKNNFHNY